jgi:UDP-N-acetylmuramate dehydrogenase
VSLDAGFVRALEGVATVRLDEPLSRHTTIGIGGPADAYVAVGSASQLGDVLRVCAEADVPVFMLGSGSNIVVGDGGIRGVVIENRAQAVTGPFSVDVAPVHDVAQLPHPKPVAGRLSDSPKGEGTSFGEPRNAEQDDEAPPHPNPLPQGIGNAVAGGETSSPERYLFRLESGCSFAAESRRLAFAGYAGLEWACGIPGTLGGAVVYNAGAYGGCLADVLQRVAVWDASEGERVFEASELGLVYRGSDFSRGVMAGRAVLWAEVALWRGDIEALKERVADYDARRLKAQPRGRNAGSFFKNPPGHPAWRLLDAVGLRGYRAGGAEFSEKHCNFLINAGGATGADVAALKAMAQERVRAAFGIELENEVTLVGEGW